MESYETKAHQLLALLELHEESHEFLAPVDFKLLNIPQYPIIIKNPMDLGTIKKNLKSHHYASIQDFMEDIQLVWDNCKKFNEASTDIYQQAVFLEKQTLRYCNKLRLTIPYSNKNKTNNDTTHEDMKNVTFEDKWSMTEAIRTLDQTALEKIIEIVREKSPESIETLDTDKIKIKLDVISRETFNQIQTIIDESSLESLPQKKP